MREPATPEQKLADTDADVADSIRERWSPRAFSERAVGDQELRALLEAARWAPSSYNEQPWRFIVARRADSRAFGRILDCLSSTNRRWASAAPVLMLTVAKRTFERSGEPNRHALHDVGLAMGNLLNQATTMGLFVHQMAGFDAERAGHSFDVPDDFAVVAAVAIGYRGDPDMLDEKLRARELAERSRKPLGELAFAGAWGRPFEPAG